jgi:hypothetical protein
LITRRIIKYIKTWGFYGIIKRKNCIYYRSFCRNW